MSVVLLAIMTITFAAMSFTLTSKGARRIARAATVGAFVTGVITSTLL